MNRTAHEHELSDADLVQGAQRGDPAAFGELVTRYQDRVFNTCYRMCHSHADALDLTQSAFLKALDSLKQFRRAANFYTWLFRIAVNLTISHRRSVGRHASCSLDGSATAGALARPRWPGGDTDVSRPTEQRELQERLAWALQQLDDEFRAVVILKDIEEMDYASIAEVLDVPIGTVKSRIHRGRLMLRELLSDERASVGRP